VRSLFRTIAFPCLGAAFLACSGSEPTAPLNRAFTLNTGASLEVSGTPISVKFVGVVEDSRCPVDVQCIWAGNGRVELEVRVNGGAPASILLNTFDGASEAVVDNYRIRLVELLPAPVSTEPPANRNYRVTLLVSAVGTVCTEEARPGLMVGLIDAVTGESTGFTEVSVVAVEGDHRDSVYQSAYPASPYNGPLPLAYERRGTYQVIVRASGYAPWTRSGVVVDGDVCHVITVPLTARLNRQ
jgi:hypothetical protein